MSNSSAEIIGEKSYILDGHRRPNQQSVLGRILSEDEQSVTDDTKQLIDEGQTLLGQHGLAKTSFNYINSIIGSGVIGIPYALLQAGFGLGLVLLVFVAWITDYSLVLMIRSGHLSGKFSYQGIMEGAFGSWGFFLLSFLQFVYPFIAMVSYNIVVGDTLTKVLLRLTGLDYASSFFVQRQFVVAVATVCVTLPLCLYRNIAKLAKISFLSLVFVLFILVAIFIRLGTLHDVVPHTQGAWAFANWDVIPAIGIIAFAFMCHHNTFLLYGSIVRADQGKWDRVTHASVLTSWVVSVLFGVAGYATFTGFSQGDLLENYCWNDDLINVARVGFSLTILLTYPMECFVTREVLENMVQGWRGGGAAAAAAAEAAAEAAAGGGDRTAPHRHYGFTLAIVAVAYLISITTDCLGMVLELNGVLAAVPLAFVLPAFSYIKLEQGPLLSRRKLPALLLGLFGLAVALVGLVLLCVNYDGVDSCNHGVTMPYCYANWTIPLD